MTNFILMFRKKLIVPATMATRNNMASDSPSIRRTEYGTSIFGSVVDLSYYNFIKRGTVENLCTANNNARPQFVNVLPDGTVEFRTIDANDDRVREAMMTFTPEDDLIVCFAQQDSRIQVLETLGYKYEYGQEYKLIEMMENMFPSMGKYIVVDIATMAKKAVANKPQPRPIIIKRQYK
ncbi:hypothetical protein SM033_00054 [Vibrio phage vB_VpaM_sm033]|nr:hypothetical protein SM033_00054 [Vibrio phage vB_VpaM_sm033]